MLARDWDWDWDCDCDCDPGGLDEDVLEEVEMEVVVVVVGRSEARRAVFVNRPVRRVLMIRVSRSISVEFEGALEDAVFVSTFSVTGGGCDFDFDFDCSGR